MCCITGWLNRNRRIDNNILLQMNNVAKHRGPDDEGYLVIDFSKTIPALGEDSISLPYKKMSDIGNSGCFLALGHRRLSIIDLSPQGHQPMELYDGKLSITFNGEIYNYIEVKHELEEKGFKFNTTSDTEVLLCAYRCWGEECVQHLNGMWGFAIWDRDNNKLFCSRDRLGAKPFYYYLDDDNYIFGSEIKQLLQNPVVPRVLNEDYMITQIMWGCSDYSDETLFKNISALKGGQNLVINVIPHEESISFDINIYDYWDINTSGEKNVNSIGEAFDYLENAMEIRTRSDVPLGVMLSGGLDSSCLLAKIAEYFKERGIDTKSINTFTSCYNDFPEGDEKEFAELASEYCGATHHEVYPDDEDIYALMEKMIWHGESFVSFNSFGSFMTMREVAKTGVKVILNGQGSDETMFGYERYYAWYLKDVFYGKGIRAFLHELDEASNNSRLSKLELIKYLVYFSSYSIRKKRNLKRMKPYISKLVALSFNNNDSIKPYVSFADMSQMQYNEIRGTQLTHILHGDDRGYMAFSMESRVPFIDYRYIEAAVRIPEWKKIQNGYTKYLLRQHFNGRLPDKIVWRKNKMGWPSPQFRWISRLDKKKVEKLFINPRSVKYFNMDAIKQAWKDDPTNYGFCQFLNVEMFLRTFDLAVPD